MTTARLTMAQALVRYLTAQFIEMDGGEQPIFAGAFAIFGHGNVVALGEALYAARDKLPTWRGQNEQSMALAAVAFAKATKRRRMMVATSSIGPGATNMVTAAAVAHSNRLPLLLLSGDTFANRMPDPVLQQVENFYNPTLTANDCFRPVTRYWDRITRPEQLIASLPVALATLLDPADCGPVMLALPQDVQAEAYDYPEAFFARRAHRIRRPRPDRDELLRAGEALRKAERPLIVAGGGVHYALAEGALAAFAEHHGIPVVVTQAARTALPWDHPLNCGPIGVTGSDSANRLAAEADTVLAVGTRLADFTTGSWSAFQDPAFRLIGLNVARFDAGKHQALPLVGDALVGLDELAAALIGWRAPAAWRDRAAAETKAWNRTVDEVSAPTNTALPSYAQVIGAVNRVAGKSDIVVSAAGGLPGELCKVWRARETASYDVEWGFSCMGYEIAGGLGTKMAHPDREVIVFCGDGSYLMMNSEIVTSVMTGHKLIIVVCDNQGFAVINRLQTGTGNAAFNNLFADCRGQEPVKIDFAAHAASMGARAERVSSLTDLAAAVERARAADRTTVIAIDTDPAGWVNAGNAWWDVAVPEVSTRPAVERARAGYLAGKGKQRIGV